MNTDLDTTLTAALRDAATTTTVSDDALATIMRRAAHRGRRPRRRRVGITVATVLLLGAGAGATFAAVADRLSPDQAELVDESTCDVGSGNARLVASTTGLGRSVEYWTVDSASSHADFLFENGGAFGGGGCGPMSRAVAYPHLPWANYTLTYDPRDGSGVGHFVFFGQAPAGTADVDIVTTAGTTHVDVASPEGYFVVLADLPLPNATPSDGPPDTPPAIDIGMFQRVDAYAADGTLLGTGGLS